MSSPVPVAEIVRSGFVEGHHYGSVVALDTHGEVVWSVGSVTEPMLPPARGGSGSAAGGSRVPAHPASRDVSDEPRLLA